ncbi:MAG: putative peptidoglycan glycosyltransferase FtsW [Simkaniaceae bacterium]|nr:putative peptidoglycan glycosyltransferase FtsW [Simkaniaceae bacterium]
MDKGNLLLTGLVVLLFLVGLVMVFGTTSAEVIALGSHLPTHRALINQGLHAIVGIAGAIGVRAVGYRMLLRKAPYLFYAVTICLIMVFVPGIGKNINGARRWITLGPLSFQPSECMKPVIPLMFLHLFLRSGKTFSFFRFCATVLLLCVPLFLILLEPDNGTVVILLATLAVLCFLSRIPWTYWVLPLLCVVIAGLLIAIRMPHVRSRIDTYLHPEKDLLGKGHQPYQAKVAAGSGGMFGRGPGKSVQKLNYLPTARSDYIVAIYAEEFGFIGILFLVILYMAIACCGFRNALRARTEEGHIIAAVMTFSVAFQAFLNLGVVSGLLPSKGTNLPFFSQGGSSLIVNSLILALTVDVAEVPKFERKEKYLAAETG